MDAQSAPETSVAVNQLKEGDLSGDGGVVKKIIKEGDGDYPPPRVKPLGIKNNIYAILIIHCSTLRWNS
jgi:hypothetical protein